MKYTWETDETDIWQHDLFDTVEDCIEDAKSYATAPGATIVVGEAIFWEPYIDVCDMLDQFEEEAYYECGEVAEDWSSYNYERDKEKVDELSEKLNEIIKQWLKDNGTYPTFYKIENVRVFEVE